MDVHYYEDGNVRMSTNKKVEVGNVGAAEAVIREIAKAENKYQEELNRAFTALAEGSFKGLRRQLPVTRQRVEWEKIAGYRVSCDVSWVRMKLLTFDVARTGCCRWEAEVGAVSLSTGAHRELRMGRDAMSRYGVHVSAAAAVEDRPLP